MSKPSPIQKFQEMLTSITPGEWTIPHFADPEAGCECGYIFGEGQRGMGAICNVGFGGEDEPREIAAANARFIVSAHNLMPEMLALWGAAECISELHSLKDNHNRSKAFNAALDALNAKASEALP